MSNDAHDIIDDDHHQRLRRTTRAHGKPGRSAVVHKRQSTATGFTSDDLKFDPAFMRGSIDSPEGAMTGILLLTTIIGQELAGNALKGPLQERLPMLFPPSSNSEPAPAERDD